MLPIPRTTLLDPVGATGAFTEFGGEGPFAGGWFTVANNPAEVQLAVRQEGTFPQWGASVYLPPATYPVARGGVQPVAGIRARNYIAGSNVEFFGALYAPGEAQIVAGSPYDSIISPSTGAVGSAMVVGHVNGAGVIQSGTGFSVVHAGVGVYDITFTNPFNAIPIVLCSVRAGGAGSITLDNANTAGIRVRTWDGAALAASDQPFYFMAQEPS